MTSISRRTALRSFSCVALALVAGRVARADETADAAARQRIAELQAGLLAVMKAGRAVPFTQRCAMLAPVLQRSFDMPATLRMVVGPRWTTLSTGRQAQLLAAFARYSVANWVANFDSWSGQTFRILPGGRGIGSDGCVVETELVPLSGTAHRLDFVMHRTSDGWRALDVLADGSISRAAVLRSDFRSLLADGTGAALTASLDRKVVDLSQGASA
ncbi:MAG TPA: ABC transporter substrate-binding protein [Acetobacteraceae bacterium]|nr:ABC transporter substrate-binding protein [Acetobacteraceae bacterium]